MDDSDFESHIGEERKAITERQEKNKTSFGAIKPYMTSAADTAVNVLNPIHTNEQGQIEWGPTLVHGLAELPLLTGAAAGAGKRIYNSIAGVDPTIAAQNAAVERAAQLKLQAAQARKQQQATVTATQNAVKQQQVSAGTPVGPAAPDLTKPLPISPEQAAARVAEMPEHPNPITKIEPSTLSQVGSSETAKITKEVTQQQKKIKGKAGGAVEPKALTEGIAKATAVESFTRDAAGNIQWKQGMSPAARAGAEAFATQFPDVAKELEAKGKFGILGAGSGDNNLYNSYGSDMMKTLRNEVNQGQMVGTYGNYEKNINPAIKAISPETALGKQLEDLRVNQPKGGVHGQLGQPVAMREGKLLIDKNKLNKTLSAGGAAALIMAIADQANAAQQRPQTVAPIVPPSTGEEAYIRYPHLERQGRAIQKAGESRIPENIQDPATYAAVRGFLTQNPESDISVLSEKRKKAQEAAYYGSQFANLLQMLGR